ncbi:MAG: FIST N-terminal domain-containing protein [Ideonella sp.]
MSRFVHAHASHTDWRTALDLATTDVAAQQRDAAIEPTLGWIYFTDFYADAAEPLLAELNRRWPDVAWVGAVGIGIAASGIEYFDQPALVLMLADLPTADFRVFSGASPLSARASTDFEAATALVHADPTTADLGELIAEMADRTATGYLFGGLASSRQRTLHIANGVYQGGISGVAFSHDVALLSRVTQGCQPVGPVRRISACEHNLVTTLDGEPALDCLLGDLQLQGREMRDIFPRLRETLVGLSDRNDDALSRPGQFGTDTRVRHLIGIDPGRRAVAIGDVPPIDMQLAFCRRDTEAARRDLVRICSEIREELEPDVSPAHPGRAAHSIAGAVYVSCSGRGGPHFGAPSAELALIRHALGDVPLVGFFAAGEIARHHLYGYTGVLTVFTN